MGADRGIIGYYSYRIYSIITFLDQSQFKFSSPHISIEPTYLNFTANCSNKNSYPPKPSQTPHNLIVINTPFEMRSNYREERPRTLPFHPRDFARTNAQMGTTHGGASQDVSRATRDYCDNSILMSFHRA